MRHHPQHHSTELVWSPAANTTFTLQIKTMVETTTEFELPGFRFHPTEEELLEFYLKNMVSGKKPCCDIIRFLNIYRHDPWELPGMAKIGEREWYFFVPRDRKQGHGGRPNRTTAKGFWKATGSDRKIFSLSDPKRIIGYRKTLVFYKGRAPRGSRTDWVMSEYRLLDTHPLSNDIVLCKIYRKATSLKVLEQRAAMEEEMKTVNRHGSPLSTPSSPFSTTSTISFNYQQQHDPLVLPMRLPEIVKKEVEDEKISVSSLQLPLGFEKLPELEVPKCNMDWSQDEFWFNSPWLQNLTSCANILNF